MSACPNAGVTVFTLCHLGVSQVTPWQQVEQENECRILLFPNKNTEQMKFIPNRRRIGSEEIVELLLNYPRITIAALAEELGYTTRGIEKQLKTLKESGEIQRIGARKNGYWQVLK